MGFYVFSLDTIHFQFQRGKIPDNDIVTFSLFVNQVNRGHGVGFFPALVSGAIVPARLVLPDRRERMSKEWLIGPVEIASGDGVSVVYSGTNTSDSPGGLNAQQQGQVETKILDSIVTGVVGAAGLGAIGAAVGAALGTIGDFIGALLGVSKQFPCNGLVFSGAVEFTGSGLEKLPAIDEQDLLLGATQRDSFTRHYTDAATHDTGVCGRIAETDVTFSISRLPSLSVRLCLRFFGFSVANFAEGMRRFVEPGLETSLRAVLLAQHGA